MSAFDPIPSIALDLQERFTINDGDYSVARWQTIADVIKRNLNNYTLTPIAAEPIPDQLAALRAIVKLLDGSQPKDVPGALMVARSALGMVPTPGPRDLGAAHSQHGIICRICTGGKACEHCKGVASMQVDGGAAL